MRRLGAMPHVGGDHPEVVEWSELHCSCAPIPTMENGNHPNYGESAGGAPRQPLKASIKRQRLRYVAEADDKALVRIQG